MGARGRDEPGLRGDDPACFCARERGEAVPASCTALGREVPQVWVDVARYAYPPLPPRADAPAVCREALETLPRERMRELLEAAAQFRLCRKAARLDRWRAEAGQDEALYRAVAEALGYRANKVPMLLLAQRFPLTLLRAQRDEIEPLLFAGSGFLNAMDFHALPGDTRGYLRGIWARWWPRRTEYERLTVPRALWNPRGVRPVNHPQRRVAALAEIVRHWPVLDALARSANVTGLRHFFSQLAHDYWDRHYTLTSKASTARMALVGETRASDLLVNVFFPAALSAAPEFWETYRGLPSPDANRRVEAAARRLFGPGPLARQLCGQAMTQQGLLQLDEDFCAACEGDCARCAFPERLARWADGE